MEFSNVFKVEFKKMILIRKKYFLSFLTDIFVYYIVFVGLYFFMKNNMNQLSNVELSNIITKQIVGYVSWFFFSFTMSFMNNEIYRELSEGTFEQLCLSQYKITHILFIRLINYFIWSIIVIFPMGLIFMLISKVKLNISFELISVFLLMMIGIMGFSFLLGGITLIYKKVGQLPYLFSIIFLGTSMLDISTVVPSMQKVLYSLPFNKGTDMMKVMAMGGYITNNDIILLTANSIVHLIIGIIVFKKCYKKSMNEGSLSRF